jgi:hypothetical protein
MGQFTKPTIAAALWLASLPAATQSPPDSSALLAAQRDAMAALHFMDGAWRGPAWTLLPNGEKRHITQTERIGPFLGGSVKVIEGRGYREDGGVGFNALGIISYDPAKRAYNMRSYALGHAGDFVLNPQPDGYVWEVPAGPNASIRYTAVIRDNTLTEVGDRIVPGREPVRVFEMKLQRIGDTDWPGANAVPAK